MGDVGKQRAASVKQLAQTTVCPPLDQDCAAGLAALVGYETLTDRAVGCKLAAQMNVQCEPSQLSGQSASS